MKSISILLVFSYLFLITACNHSQKTSTLSALETASAFLENSKLNQFEKSYDLLLKNGENQTLFESYQSQYKSLTNAIQKKNAVTPINILEWNEQDSISTMIYEDLIWQQKCKIAIIRKDGQWLVDLHGMQQLK